ncbi:hypothetical protein N9A72_00540 [bacterium]|nr:hypothetical protein [bacterium]
MNKERKVYLGLMVVISIISIISFIAESMGKKKVGKNYIAKRIVEAKWGKRRGEVGYTPKSEIVTDSFTGESTLEVGPSCFTIDKNGNIYIVDGVNKRIQKYTSKGKLVLEFNIKLLGYDITIDHSGNMYLVAPPVMIKEVVEGRIKGALKGCIDKYDSQGNFVKKIIHNLDFFSIQDIDFSEGNFYVTGREKRGNAPLVQKIFNSKWELIKTIQEKNIKKVFSDGLYDIEEKKDKIIISKYDKEGNLIKKFLKVKREPVDSYKLLWIDVNGNSYLDYEKLKVYTNKEGKEKIKTFFSGLRKIDGKGNIISDIPFNEYHPPRKEPKPVTYYGLEKRMVFNAKGDMYYAYYYGYGTKEGRFLITKFTFKE